MNVRPVYYESYIAKGRIPTYYKAHVSYKNISYTFVPTDGKMVLTECHSKNIAGFYASKNNSESLGTETTQSVNSYTYDNKTVYYQSFSSGAFNFSWEEYVPDIGTIKLPMSMEKAAWTVIYGYEANINGGVSIMEGGITRKFSPVDRLKINNTDSSHGIWISKDCMYTGTLYATENGIYIASVDGYDAYDEVVIRVTDDSEWTDVYPDDCGTWDEATYEEYLEDPEAFDELFNDEDKWKDEDLGENLDYKYEDKDDGISGIDPYTGNEINVNLDDDGYLKEKVLPSSISITREPIKHIYTNGQTISYLGIIVTAYTADGDVWTDEDHPDGIIPKDELTFTVHTAFYDFDNELIYYESKIADGKIATYGSAHVGYREGTEREISHDLIPTDGKMVLIECHSKNVAGFYASKNNSESLGTETTLPVNSYTYDNKTVYYQTFSWGAFNFEWEEYMPDIGTITLPMSWEQAAWTVIYGEEIKEAKMDIPVYWARPDGDALSDSFEIIVIPGKGDDSSDISGYKLNNQNIVGLYYDPDLKKVIAPNIGEYTISQAVDIGLLIPKNQ